MRLMIADVSARGTIRTVLNRREPVRLGKDVFATRAISPEILEKGVDALKRFRALCDKHDVLMVRAVGTSALREARNGAAFVADVQAETGIKLDIITGTEEARLIQLAVARQVNFKRKLAVVIDIGGGSTEVSLVLNGDIIVSETHRIGAVRLLHLLEVEKYPFKVFSRLVGDYVKGLRRQLKREIGNRHIDLCVGTGGNFEALGQLRSVLLKKRDKNHLPLKDLNKVMETINGLSNADRVRVLGLRPDRADVIGPAAAIVAEIMREAGVKDVLLPYVGLKDGLLIDLLPNLKGGHVEIQRRQLLAFAHELLRKYQAEVGHAETVAARAAYFFDRTQKLHRLGKEYRVLLEVAALLHDIGHFISSEEHHKHSQYLIRSTPFVGIDKRAQDIIACIARYHRKSPPRPVHDVYRELSKADQRIVETLASLLRIADATDRGQGRVKKCEVRFHKKECQLFLKGAGDLLLEQWAIKKKADMFEKRFKMKVVAAKR